MKKIITGANARFCATFAVILKHIITISKTSICDSRDFSYSKGNIIVYPVEPLIDYLVYIETCKTTLH